MAVTINFVASRGPYATIPNELNGPYSIDFHPGKELILETNMPASDFNQPGLQLKVFRPDEPSSSPSPFATSADLGDREIKIATVRDGNIGGFTVGETFTSRHHSGAGGDQGIIVRISPDGSTIDNPWVTLPQPNPARSQGIVYGLCVDRTDAFNGDLIAVTQNGNVWRINSTRSGTHCPIAMFNRRLEGVTTVPDQKRYGPWAGTILVGAPHIEGVSPPGEQSGIFAIYRDGTSRFFPANQLHISEGIGNGCNISLIHDKENLFALQYSHPATLPERTVVWEAKSSDFASIIGDILLQLAFPLVNLEPVLGPSFSGVPSSGLWSIRWDDASQDFKSTLLSATYNPPIDWGAVNNYVNHWTGMTFAPAYISGPA